MSAPSRPHLVVMGDSIGVGIGDAHANGSGWRGFSALLTEALGPSWASTNVSACGARIADVRRRQLPAAVAVRPHAAICIAGMNDTLRSDFDAAAVRVDLAAIVQSLADAGAVVVVVRYHDHTRLFRLPSALGRTLRRRIEDLNAAVDAVIADAGPRIRCIDLDAVPGVYDLASWSVDRLHPSELGHRRLAHGLAGELTRSGCVSPARVSLECHGGRAPTRAEHLLWLALQGTPWLARRGRDLVPYAAALVARDLRDRLRPEPGELEACGP